MMQNKIACFFKYYGLCIYKHHGLQYDKIIMKK